MGATEPDITPEPELTEPPQSGHRVSSRLPTVLFALGLAVYLLTRVIGLADYPIYFFCDEAVQTNLAADFVHDGYVNHQSEFFPTFFKNADRFNLGPSVYLQVLPTVVFGKSVFITRLAAMLVTVLAFIWVCLILRDVFELEHWWIGGLLLSITPAWFLHSRTAFETTMMASFYAGFLYEYLRYRGGETRRLYLALLWGSLAFYSYSPGRVIVVATGLVFLLADLGHHLRHRRAAFQGAGLLILLSLPFARFLVAHPDANSGQLRAMASYWLLPTPLSEKLGIYASEYLSGLDPRYWFLPNTTDFHRHIMGPNPHISTWLLPLFIIGLIIAVIGFRRPSNRLLLLSALIVPCAAAIIAHSITRLLAFVIPASLLMALAADLLIRTVSRRSARVSRIVGVGVFVLLALVNARLLTSALDEGPTWHHDYGIGGMQWGANQLYSVVDEMLEQQPSQSFLISSDWTNGADIVARFFLDDGVPVELGSLMPILHRVEPGIEDRILVAIPQEYAAISGSGKFAEIEELRMLPYPTGKRGFTFLRLTYRDDVEEMLAAEARDRQLLTDSVVHAWRRELVVAHSDLDIGFTDEVFDGDDLSVVRTSGANPMMLRIDIDEPVEASGLRLVIGSTEVRIDLDLFEPGNDVPISFLLETTTSLERPWTTVDFGRTVLFDRLSLRLTDHRQADPGHVHLFELTPVE